MPQNAKLNPLLGGRSRERGTKPTGVCFQYADTRTCRFGNNCKFLHESGLKSSSYDASRESLLFISNTKKFKGSLRKRNRKKKSPIPYTPADALDEFFASYPAFKYNRNAPSQEFYRMCDFFDCDWEDPERKKAHNSFKTALVLEFNSIYGAELDNMESWRKPYFALDIASLPEDVERNQCADISNDITSCMLFTTFYR